MTSLAPCNALYAVVEGIGCYVCKSVNGSDTKCEDTFNSYDASYQSSCFAAKSNARGKFPATTCIKFKASKGLHKCHH